MWIGLVGLLAGCGGGVGGGGGSSPPPAADTTPEAFAFSAQTGTTPSTVVASNEIVVTGITANAPISITGGEYSINGGAFTAAPGSVANNQTIRVRATSSAEPSATVTVTLTIGGVTASFTVTTADPDTTPDALQFQRVVNATRGAQVTSNSVTVASINVPTPVSIENGEYSIDGGAFTSTAGSIRAGQTLAIRARASTLYSKATVARVTVGSVTATFEVLSEVPAYVPDSVVFDGEDIVYLLSGNNRLILRWSLAEERYLDAYVVGSNGAPSVMTYSASHQRLYVGYSSGAIRFIDVTADSGTETDFVNLTNGLAGLLAAGNYVWAEGAGYFAYHYTFDRSGIQTHRDPYGMFAYSQAPTWDPVNSRVYLFRDGAYIQSEVVDQTTGQISIRIPSSYYGSAPLQAPIRVSENGEDVLLGSGSIYEQAELKWAGSLGGPIADARWFADGSVVTLNVTSDNQTTLRRRAGTNWTNLEQVNYTGQPLRIVGTDAKMAALLINNGSVRFQIYVPNDDSDGDGVINTQDAFPLDLAASVDTDHDGYPDAWNSGRSQSDSTTGLSLDAFPQDSACYLASHGSGASCNYTATVPNYVPDQVVHHGDTVYLLSTANRRVYRYSIASGAYLNPYVVGIVRGSETLGPLKMAYSANHQRLYLGYSTGAIQYIDVTSGGAEVPFGATSGAVGGLVAAGNYLMVQDYSDYRSYDYVFDRDGVLTDVDEWYYYYAPGDYAWDPVNSRVYLLRNSSPGQLAYAVINQATGQITSRGEPPYYYNYGTSAPVRVSANGESILVGSNGDIYNNALTWLRSLSEPVADARWFSNGSLVTLGTANNQTTLRRRGSNLTPAEQVTYTGQALRVVGSDTRMAVLVVDGGTVRFHIYVPDDDSDNDGVNNTQDAFPLDPAASVDSDRDGYPDAWNAGRGPGDSTTGLSLDEYPQDSACYLPSHGTGAICNYGAGVPNYVPDQVIQNGDTVYLLSSANRRVYRWSITTASYMNPYVVGINQSFGALAPTKMAYSSAHQRLYLGYSTGAIQYIDVTSGNSGEVAFASTVRAVNGLAAVGNYLLAQDDSGYWGSHYIFDTNGVITTRTNWYQYSSEYAWDPATSRVYYLRDNTTPNNLLYEVIDQATGQITATGEAPYHGAYTVHGPIRVSSGGQHVLLGSGDLYNRNGLTRAGSLSSAIADARWFANNSLAALRTTNDQTTLRRLGANLETLEQRTYTGTALRIVGSDTRMAVLVNNNGAVQFHIYEPDEDSDNDGVTNTQDAFPLDPAASVDTDRDGYPDAWNAGSGAGDSTTGLSLDAYPQDAACYLASHGDGVSCNYAATIPSYAPDQMFNVGDTVYLLSSANRRVYRWSMATRTYLDPYVVSIDQGFSVLAPSKMAYSSAQQRLYLGYASGAIRYIDLTSGSGALVPFTSIPSGVEGLAAVGNYLLAVDRRSSWETMHYVIDNNGVMTDQDEFNYYSTEYVWDPVSSRAYYISNNYLLFYKEIDQTSGLITAEGEAQYNPSSTVSAPIRVSPDGQRILIGNGDILARSTLTRATTLGKDIKDARWTDHALVDLDTTDRVEIRDLNTRDVLAYTQYPGQPVGLVFGQTEAFLVHVVNGTTAFVRLRFYDQDGDSLPRWWEDLYDLSDSNAADALGDGDGDGVSNADEYVHHTNPELADSDGDGLSDQQEILTYSTDPSRADTDRDGLKDGPEVVTHQSDPLDADSDDDGYTDFDEVLYGGDPNDEAEVPQPLVNYTQSFENNPDLRAWSTPEDSHSDWTIDSTVANTGAASLKAGTIANRENSSIRFRGFFTAGQLSFHARGDSQYCCDRLSVWVDGVLTGTQYTSNQWNQIAIPIAFGVHTIEWRFEKESYYNQTSDAHIDDVVFVGQ
jgi:hypothetical protein